MSTAASPLPVALEVRELLEGLLGRDVDAVVGTKPVNPQEPPGAIVGVYVDDLLTLRAIILTDVALSAYVGAALALIPARTAGEAAEEGRLTPNLYDNTREVLNVAASLFNHEGAPHVRLYEAYAPREVLPPDVAKYVLAYVRRLDMELEVAGYGKGLISVLAI